jgi:hypothetical protein
VIQYTVLWNTPKAKTKPMKYYISYILLYLSSLSFAQTIPNGDFEQWEVRDHFKLSEWYSPTRNVERTTDAKEGNYAIKLINTYSATSNGAMGYARNLDYNNKQDINGTAISGDALSISFWCKYDLAAGDTARFYVVLREEGAYKGKVDFRFTGNSANKYVKFSIPIDWNSSGNRRTDSAWIYLYSCRDNVVDGDGYVTFDDIAFENIGRRVGGFDNSGFEEWYNIGVDFPSDWRPLDLLIYDTYSSFLSSKSCTKSSKENAHTGNHSLVIQNYVNGTNVQRGYAFLGDENDDYYTPHTPFLDTFKYLQGYYKFLPDGPDTARITVRTFANGQGRRSYNDFNIQEESIEWTFFSIPLTYNGSYAPDSASLMFYSAVDDDGIYGLETRLFLDNLELVLEPTPLKLAVQEITSAVYYYPNPTSGLVFIDAPKKYILAQITNILGQSDEIEIFNNTIDLRQEPSGLYFISLRDVNNQISVIRVLKN